MKLFLHISVIFILVCITQGLSAQNLSRIDRYEDQEGLEMDNIPRSAADSIIGSRNSSEPTHSQHPNHLLFTEDFTNNHQRWCTGDDTSREITLDAGKYRIKGYDHRGHNSSKYFSIDVNKPFTCSVTTQWLSGDTSHGFGLNFCSDMDSKSYYCLMLAANGYYAVKYTKNGVDWGDLIPWTRSEIVNKGNKENTLRIHKEDDVIKFYVNGQEIGSELFGNGFGRSFGCRAADQQTVLFDDFILEGE